MLTLLKLILSIILLFFLFQIQFLVSFANLQIFDRNRVSATCLAAFNKLISSSPAQVWPPPCPVPASLRKAFEGPDGSMPVTRDYCQAQRYEGELVVDWNEEFVSSYCRSLGEGSASGSYLPIDDALVREVIYDVPGINGSTGMVLGSERPWVECFAINAGAATVWTFEYATIISTHPKLKSLPYKVIAADHLSG